jgi:hypothetical protein
VLTGMPLDHCTVRASASMGGAAWTPGCEYASETHMAYGESALRRLPNGVGWCWRFNGRPRRSRQNLPHGIGTIDLRAMTDGQRRSGEVHTGRSRREAAGSTGSMRELPGAVIR